MGFGIQSTPSQVPQVASRSEPASVYIYNKKYVCLVLKISETSEPIGLYSYTYWSCDGFKQFSWGGGTLPTTNHKKIHIMQVGNWSFRVFDY